jgi:hypothetical protein
MGAVTPIYRSESERSTLGQFGVDTVEYRFRPVGEEFWAGLLSQPLRAIGGAAVLNGKPAGIVVSIYPGIVRVEGRLDPLLALKLTRRAVEVVEIPLMLAIAHANGAGTDDEWPTQIEYAEFWKVTERTARRQWALYRTVFGPDADPYVLAKLMYAEYSARIRKRDFTVAFQAPASLLAAA